MFTLKTGQLDHIYHYLTDEFPAHELKSYKIYQELIMDQHYDVLLAYDNDNLVGYALIFRPQLCQTLWLDFIAILPNHQSKGYGSILIKEVLNYYQPQYKGMVFEVEIPVNDNLNQIRRIRYYERLGAITIPIAYSLPTNTGPFPMYLMQLGEACEHIQTLITESRNYIHRDLG